MSSWDGLLLVDKPAGPTSHDMVDRIRRATGQRRVGHAGTLDPMATGLLPLVLGRATRLVRYLPHSPKTYAGALRLGLTTDSDDITGSRLTTHDGDLPDEASVRREAQRLVGRTAQVPPRISARKVGGRRMYRLAREGAALDPPPSDIEVFVFEVERTSDRAVFAFRTRVTQGTYVRALIRDLGHSLGCGATLSELRRTSIGPMELSAALPLAAEGTTDAERLAAHLVPLSEMPLEPPLLRLTSREQARRFAAGGALATPADAVTDGPYRVVAPDGRLLGVAVKQGELLQPRVVVGRREDLLAG